ncbi:hypothetical protein Y1Q_0014813 [Alligator mississippiensis]|uniref:Reverse transcriptase domain-containing protein n=1 Tax=Alligator mississippiensis TaxID=8496 RepID=A0A151M212_ALLMI|nr:hypothetical protein Y1Q_0014813 [Alligator mississippiensis]
MKTMGIIEESRSPWRSQVVVVPKTNGSIKLCIDYHKVNKVVTFNTFLMPQVDNMLEKVSQDKYISTLDSTRAIGKS